MDIKAIICVLMVLSLKTFAFDINSKDALTLGSAEPKKKACYGTYNGLSWSGSLDYWYRLLRRRYHGCTHVLGNLEISHLEQSQHLEIDLSFLSTIEVVTGYVLFVNVHADVIPLTRLRHIRGDEKFAFQGKEYALAVLLSDSPNGLQLPAIKEISGNVLFYHWSACYVHSIAWDSFTKGIVVYLYEKRRDCQDCDPACLDTDGSRRCWGPGKDMCQIVNRMECGWFCRNGTCHEEGILGCCHPECLGCYDGWVDSACDHCRHFRYGEHCVPECPEGTYPFIDTCLPIKPRISVEEDNMTI